MDIQDTTEKSSVLGESTLQLRVISHCKQEMISSLVVAVFGAVVGIAGLCYALSIAEPEDALKILATILGSGFLGISFLFLMRTLIRWGLLGAAKEQNLKKLLWTVVLSASLDLVIILLSLAVIFWTGVYQWLLLVTFSIILDVWRLNTVIKYVIECKASVQV